MTDSIKFHGLEVLEVCPDLWLISCYGSGDNSWSTMINAVAETFGPEEYGAATHLHFYANRKEAEKIWGEIDIPDTIKTVSFIRNYEEAEMADSIKSEKYFGEAWKNATPEQRKMIMDTLSKIENNPEENTMKNRCEAITAKKTRCRKGGTNLVMGITTCNQDAHNNWAQKEGERRMQEFVAASKKDWDADLAPTEQDKLVTTGVAMNKEKNVEETKELSKSAEAMLRGGWILANKAGLKSWTARIEEVQAKGDVAEVAHTIKVLREHFPNIRPVYDKKA